MSGKVKVQRANRVGQNGRTESGHRSSTFKNYLSVCLPV